MSNKFTKSVLERQYKELNIEAPTLQTTSNEVNPVIDMDKLDDLDALSVRFEVRRAKNKTFYLDNNVIEGIKQAASSQNVTESKLVNDIFKKLLKI